MCVRVCVSVRVRVYVCVRSKHMKAHKSSKNLDSPYIIYTISDMLIALIIYKIFPIQYGSGRSSYVL